MTLLKRLLLLFIGWKTVIAVSALLATVVIPLRYTSIGRDISLTTPYHLWIWANFDGVNYITIARTGYHSPNFAFFPLFPFFIHLANNLMRIPLVESALWISNLSTLLALPLLYGITRLDFNKRTAFRTVVFMLAIPVSFYYQAAYADSLFLLFATLSFYFARKSNWLLAGVFGYTAGLARLVGITLFPVLLIEWYLQHNRSIKNVLSKETLKTFVKDRAFFILLVPLGLLSYATYLYINYGDFLLFQKSMQNWQQSRFVFPPQVIFRYLKIFFTGQFNFIYFVAVLEFVATAFYFLLSFYVMKKVRLSYGVYMVLLLLIPVFTGTLQSMPRYILHLFPAFIGLSLLTSKINIFWLFIGIFLILQFVLIVFFTRGYFIG